MGLFSWAKSAWNSAKEKVSQAYNFVKEKAKEAVNYVKEKASNMWAGFTGEKDAKRAKELYEQAKQKYEDFKAHFENEVAKFSQEINIYIEKINNLKVYYFDNLLVDFKRVISKVSGLDIESEEQLDGHFGYSYQHERLKRRSQIIKIDFDAHRFKNTVKAIVTLGFATRKAAKESLQEAEAYELGVNECIAKMKGELSKLARFSESVQNLLSYFTNVIQAAERCIDRLRHSLALLKNIHLVRSYSIINGKYDARKLPKAQVKTFMVTNNLMKILQAMSTHKYINATGDNIEECDLSAAKQYAAQIRTLPAAV